MKIQEFTEAREAPLYHWMDNSKMRNVLGNNKLEGRWMHQNPLSKERMVGTSLSRNPNFLWAGTVVRLVFDQWKLDQAHKIVPLDADYTWEFTQGYSSLRQDRVRRGESDPTQIDSSVLYPMAEEFVIGDIEPLNKYLIRIDVLPYASDSAIQDIEGYSERFNVPMKVLPHPEQVQAQNWQSPRFNPPIREAREAPLYHWMDAKKVQAVVQVDAMAARHVHRLPWTDEKTKGTSMSRNERFTFGLNKPWRFVFDEGKLAQTNKIVPVDAQAVHRYTISKGDPTQDPAGDYKFSDIDFKDRRSTRNWQFAEEFILGDITPMSRYLVRIDYYPDSAGQASASSTARMRPPGVSGDKWVVAVEKMVRKYAKQHNIPYRISDK